MTPSPTDRSRVLIDRIRPLLPDPNPREVPMFGVRALMVAQAMAVAVHNDGSLLVRVDPAEDPELVSAPGASRAEMGTGRSMGVGWIRVEAAALQDDETLAGWVEAALRNLARRGQTES